MFLIATAACVLVIMSLVHFLMALSANYAHIRGHDKFTDFVDLHNIDMTSESVQLTEVNAYAHDLHTSLTDSRILRTQNTKF